MKIKLIELILLTHVMGVLFANTMGANVFGQATALKQIPLRNGVSADFVSPSTVAGPVIPGLQRGFVPQGLAYDSSRKLIFISHYAAKDPSVVSVINSVT